MLILEVDGHVHERKGTRKKDGSDFTIRYQEAKIIRENHLDRVVKISIPGEGKYEPGLYTVSADSFRPGEYERLIMGYVDLMPLEQACEIANKQLKASRARRPT